MTEHLGSRSSGSSSSYTLALRGVNRDTTRVKITMYHQRILVPRQLALAVAVSLSCHVTCTALAAPPKRRATAVPTVGFTVEEQQGFSRRIDDLFSRAITALREGRADEFRGMLSSSTIDRETRGSDAIEKVIRTRFIPFFAGMKKLTATSASIPTQDPEGHKGIALGHSFLTHDGDERSFIMYIVEEDGELVVSNLLLDKTIADLKEAQP